MSFGKYRKFVALLMSFLFLVIAISSFFDGSRITAGVFLIASILFSASFIYFRNEKE